MSFNIMKDMKPRLMALFEQGYCTSQIGRIASTIDELAATIRYNIKRLEDGCATSAGTFVFNREKLNRISVHKQS